MTGRIKCGRGGPREVIGEGREKWLRAGEMLSVLAGPGEAVQADWKGRPGRAGGASETGKVIEAGRGRRSGRAGRSDRGGPGKAIKAGRKRHSRRTWRVSRGRPGQGRSRRAKRSDRSEPGEAVEAGRRDAVDAGRGRQSRRAGTGIEVPVGRERHSRQTWRVSRASSGPGQRRSRRARWPGRLMTTAGAATMPSEHAAGVSATGSFGSFACSLSFPY